MMKTLPGKRCLVAIATVLIGLAPAHLVAQVVTANFNGASSEDFSDDDNWSTGVVPGLNSAAAIADSFLVTLNATQNINRLVLGNDATLSILSGGHLTGEAGQVWVGFTGANNVTGTGTATLNLAAGGSLFASEHLYIASGNPHGRGAVVNLNGGTVNVANRFWVGSGAINDNVIGTLNINGSAIDWANRVQSMNFGEGEGRAVINFILDGGGLTTLTTQDLTLDDVNASLTVDFSAYAIAGEQVFELISYSGVRTGVFDNVSFTGLPAGQTAGIDYGSGTNDAVRVSVVTQTRSSQEAKTRDSYAASPSSRGAAFPSR